MKNPSQGTIVIGYKELWSVKLADKFTTMAIATLFRPKGRSIVMGCEDGMVRLYDVSVKAPNEKPQTVLETKSGPIQCAAIHDVTRFYHNDLVVGDSHGMLTIFCNHQILSRQSLSNNSIIHLTVIEEEDGGSVIITTNDSGVIRGTSATTELWRIDLNSLSNNNPSLPIKVGCVLSVQLPDCTGNRRKYILAADNSRRIHIICQGSVVSSLHTPASITAMTQGRFVPSSQFSLSSPVSSSSDCQQVALGAQNGSVYILHQFNVTVDEYVNTKAPITSLSTLPHLDSCTDYLLCAGHFSSLLVFKDGVQTMEYPSSDWVNNIVTADLDDDNVLEVVVGCMDGSVTALKL